MKTPRQLTLLSPCNPHQVEIEKLWKLIEENIQAGRRWEKENRHLPMNEVVHRLQEIVQSGAADWILKNNPRSWKKYPSETLPNGWIVKSNRFYSNYSTRKPPHFVTFKIHNPANQVIVRHELRTDTGTWEEACDQCLRMLIRKASKLLVTK